MMDLYCSLNIIVYAGNEEYPETLEIGSDNHLIIPPEFLEPLRIVNKNTLQINLSEDTTVGDLIHIIKEKVDGIDLHYYYWDDVKWAINKNDRFYLDNYNQNLLYLLKKYFNYPENDNIELQILVSANAGEIDNADGLEYYVYSKENGKHHLPHLHVNSTDHDHYAVIRIDNGEIIEGELPGKLKRRAIKRILDNQEYFYTCWNTMTDGLKVDINKHFHLIHY